MVGLLILSRLLRPRSLSAFYACHIGRLSSPSHVVLLGRELTVGLLILSRLLQPRRRTHHVGVDDRRRIGMFDDPGTVDAGVETIPAGSPESVKDWYEFCLR